MNWIQFTLLVLLLVPMTSHGQFKIKGVVRDSVTREALPGVNVEIKGEAGTVTNSSGEFEIDSKKQTAEITFSFIGLKTKVVSLSNTSKETIDLSYDPKSDEAASHFIKTSLDVGYYGDKDQARVGIIANYSLQSIGDRPLNINSNFKFWKEQMNSGIEFSVSKDLTGKINYLADNLFLSYKSVSYRQTEFTWTQARGLVANEFPRFFELDIGGAYNELGPHNEKRTKKTSYFSGIIGLTKIFSFSSVLKNWGFHSHVNFNSARTFYEIGTYKGIYIKKFPEITVMAKYYNYGDIDGLMLSLRLKMFDTRYYCCHSWKVYYDYLNVIK